MAISNAILAGLRRTELLHMHYQMALIRRFEEKSAEEYTRGKIGGFMHLYIGQEAVGVGCITALHPSDKILCSYREHGYALARGMDPNAVMSELFGKSTGCSKGKGGSMHMWSNELGVLGGNAIVAAQLPIAAGVALAAQYQGKDTVTACFLAMEPLTREHFTKRLTLHLSGSCRWCTCAKTTSTRWVWRCIKPGQSIALCRVRRRTTFPEYRSMAWT